MSGQSPILTVTLNPALDVSTAADKVRPDLKLRCDKPVFDPGGGGINVSRAIKLIGGQSRAMVALGGATGARMGDMLKTAGLDVLRLTAPGETRQSLAVTDRATGGQFRFVMPGPEWHMSQTGTALAAIAEAALTGGWVVMSGSNPPGIAPGFEQMLTVRLKDGRAKLMVDTSGDALMAMAGSSIPVDVLRMDSHEAEMLAGRPLPDRMDSADFATGLVRDGAARIVIVARGAEGSVLADMRGAWHAEAAPVKVVSAVGAGDSFVAGFVLAMARGWPPEEALALGAAAASAAVMTPATELCRAEDVRHFYSQRVVTRLS
ncbi:1-phosphofructokinase family hexose kinase [Paracoccus sp. 1_MG-2023]|uniref:1-phosphofructokinase family hexose kinase n=1 Tax=unclassified Paracoccus (in: a-proteobacteria) TaxID=2688777 RepID=UPI001C089761|nr:MULTISPECIES: 1-phosphofructokinase family hexose kinase [unclassified Paracoccus (in: a-proteobacteria)]MBU2957071.1 1-phosphofructokinase family hexose kinase [Paracoccus sp. C2R09]MDO6668269.1 1-phosphofructokinase family hexose kinase [Paracoccus sp. 1_MG-2023]